MASLWKHPQSKFWVACFTDANRKQRKRSTKETDKKKAQKMAETFEAAYRQVRTTAQMQRVMSDIHREITGETIKPVSIVDFQKTWLASKKAEGCAESSQVFYTHSTTRFIKWLGEDSKKPISSIGRAQVEAFRNGLAETLATKTTNHQLKGLRMLFKAALEQGLVTENPAAQVKTISTKRAPTKRKEAFSMDQVRTILASCPEEWRSMVLLGVYTGQRLADLQHLKWSQVSKDGSMITLVTRKTGRSMTIPAAATLKAHIRSLKRPKDPEAYLHPKLAELKTNSLSGLFADILIKAKIRPKDVKGDRRDHSGLSFHSLRHTAVTLLKEAGVPLATVMALVGHDSEAMSENYTKIGPEAMAAGAAKMPSL